MRLVDRRKLVLLTATGSNEEPLSPALDKPDASKIFNYKGQIKPWDEKRQEILTFGISVLISALYFFLIPLQSIYSLVPKNKSPTILYSESSKGGKKKIPQIWKGSIHLHMTSREHPPSQPEAKYIMVLQSSKYALS